MNAVLNDIHHDFQCDYISDKSLKLPSNSTKFKTINTPSFLINNPSKLPTEYLKHYKQNKHTTSSVVLTHLKNAVQHPELVFWHSQLTGAIHKAITRNKYSAVIIQWGMIGIMLEVFNKLRNKIKKLPPIFVVYYSPTLDSKWYPFIFNDIHKQSTVKLYKGAPYESEYNYSSLVHTSFPFESLDNIKRQMKELIHIDCTSPIIQMHPNNHGRISSPKEYLSLSLPFYKIASMVLTNASPPESKKQTRTILSKTISRRKFVFVTLGSYSKHVIDIFSADVWTSSWNQFGKLYNCDVIIHTNVPLNTEACEFVQVLNCIIDYETVLLYDKLQTEHTLWKVFFTGSAVLQNYCWACQTPMCFIPFLSEQFFFARVYKEHCGVPFIDHTKSNSSLLVQLKAAVHSKHDKKNQSVHKQVYSHLMNQLDAKQKDFQRNPEAMMNALRKTCSKTFLRCLRQTCSNISNT